ncbi:hypothetical protein [Streptomyces griseus]|uniref:hypothetical protein n=1 Tax=Streptomyces griseus TaxID=1911 RepID=UPI00379ACA23
MKFTKDLLNNVGRRCSIRGDATGRIWKVRTAMQDTKEETHYLCRNTHTGDFRVVSLSLLTSLY